MKFYISDLHFGHENVIKFDGRPFDTVEEMDAALIENWNSVVDKSDEVYVLGDFCWSTDRKKWSDLIDKLNGSIHLIKGNHDVKKMPKETKLKFASITDYKEINDNGRRVIMSHYPIPFYRSDYNENIYHLYGHVHVTLENDLMEDIKQLIKSKDDRGKGTHKLQMYNVGCMMPWMYYRPRTLDEIIKFEHIIKKAFGD